MPRKQKKYHYIYKTTNLVNGKYYIGMHSTDNLNDGYVGSGKRLWYSINKYGKKNFKFDIIEFLPDRSSLKEREKELVNEDLLKDSMCLNIKTGGYGGWYKFHNDAFKQKLKNDPKLKEKYIQIGKNISKIVDERGTRSLNNGWSGKKHKDSTIEKMKKIKKQKGNKNSQFGTCWITNGIENKKIKQSDAIPENWYKGRKTKLIGELNGSSKLKHSDIIEIKKLLKEKIPQKEIGKYLSH